MKLIEVLILSVIIAMFSCIYYEALNVLYSLQEESLEYRYQNWEFVNENE